MTDNTKAFRSLHIQGAPLILWNVWDAGSARVLSEAGAAAVATGSFALAGALGYEDGEVCPREEVLNTLALICRVAACPVSHDCERGYGATTAEVGDYVRAVWEAGAVGINLEDGLGGGGLRDMSEQAERIAAAKSTLGDGFLNARADVFFVADERADAEKLDEVAARAAAYRAAGADGLFVPGLLDLALIEDLAARIDLPLNVMRPLDGPPVEALAAAGVARISHGPFPWLKAMADLKAVVGG